jgi:hypothetical protein
MDFSLEIEGNGIKKENVENYEEIQTQITAQLEKLKE